MTFSGRKAFSWLAGHSYRIGFDEGRGYGQIDGLEIFKSDQENGYMSAPTAAALQAMKELLDDWRRHRPEGVNMGDIN